MAAGAKKRIVDLVPKKIVSALKPGWQGFRRCKKQKRLLQIMVKANLICRANRCLVGFSSLPRKVQAIWSLSPQLPHPTINHGEYCWFVVLLKEEPTDPLGQEGRKISFVSGQMLWIGLSGFISYLTQSTKKQKHSRVMWIKFLYFRKLWEKRNGLTGSTPANTYLCTLSLHKYLLLILHWASGPLQLLERMFFNPHQVLRPLCCSLPVFHFSLKRARIKPFERKNSAASLSQKQAWKWLQCVRNLKIKNL